MLKKAKVYIGGNYILRANFSINWGDNINKQEEKKDKNIITSKSNIKPVSQNKKMS